ncbi:methyltransferase domain-containing protein [candidate division KSB1 bacterium]|nr:methyltransferase domain-containing protein [candidate division KSB1 bacterium]
MFKKLKVNSDITALPIKSNSIDLLLTSEVLEHLENEALEKAVTELQRSAGKYILITVPNHEMLAKNALKCPKCNSVFNASYHVQSFTTERLQHIFPGFKCLKVTEFGPGWRRYVPSLLKIRHNRGNGWFKIPPSRTVMCPNCENTTFPKFKMNPIVFVCDGINKFTSPRRPYYLIALYERKI